MAGVHPGSALRLDGASYPSPRAPLPAAGRPLDAWLEALAIEALWAAEWRCAADWGIPRRRIGDSMWWWLLEGEGSAAVGEHAPAEACRAGDLILVPQDEVHELLPAPGSCWRILVVHFHARVHGGADLLRLLGFPHRVRPLDAEAWTRRDRRLAREHALQQPGWRGAMAAGIRSALLELVRDHGDAFAAPPPSVSEALARLEPVFALIEARLDDPGLRSAHLAARIHVSEVRLRSLFGEAMAISPMRFLLERRIERACARLRADDDGVARIAAACGFTDTAYFCRAFKRRIGRTPSDYRRSAEL